MEMIKTQQTMEWPDGDCFRACVASILERPLDKTPNYHGTDWWDRWQSWGERHGVSLLNYWLSEMNWSPVGYWIANPFSPLMVKEADGEYMCHAVVVEKGVVVWDPHPKANERLPIDLSTATDCTILELR